MTRLPLPPGQQLVAADKWPIVGERAAPESSAPWIISVGGPAARSPYQLSLAELQALPQSERTIDIHCVTRWSKLGVRFSGVPLAELLERAQPTERARFVSFVARSARAHSTSLPLSDDLTSGMLVAFAVDGAPLLPAHGGPVRMVVAGRYFYKSLKWLERIDLIEEDRLGYWETAAGYHNAADPWKEERYLACGLSPGEARAILQRRDFSGRDLRGLNAAGHDLRGLMARGSLLRDADFRRSVLIGANFDGANLTNGHLEGADLRDASFRDADLEGANLAGADLRGACLLGASLTAATFCQASDSPADGDGNPAGAVLDERTQVARSALEDLTPDQREFMLRTLARLGL